MGKLKDHIELQNNEIIFRKQLQIKIVFFATILFLLFSHVEILFVLRVIAEWRTYSAKYILNLSFIVSVFLFNLVFIFSMLYVSGYFFALVRRKSLSVNKVAAFISAFFGSFLLALGIYSFILKVNPVEKFFIGENLLVVIFLFFLMMLAGYTILKSFLYKNVYLRFTGVNLISVVSYFCLYTITFRFLAFFLVFFGILILSIHVIARIFNNKTSVYFYGCMILSVLFFWGFIIRCCRYEIPGPMSAGQIRSGETVDTGRGGLSKPNIILIVLDTFRADHLDLSPGGITPNLALFAADSVTYKNCFSTSSWTLPAHASLFTGLYPTTHGAQYLEFVSELIEEREGVMPEIREMYYPLAPENITMAEILGKNGYRTYGVAANRAFLKPETGLTQGFETYDNRSNPITFYKFLFEELDVFPYIRAISSVFTEAIGLSELELTYIRKACRRAGSINETVMKILDERSGGPFFLFINYMDTHAPQIPDKKYREEHDETIDDKRFVIQFARNFGYMFEWEELVKGEIKFSEDLKKHLHACYEGEVVYLDSQIGYLFEYLKKSGLYDGSMIIVTADHGEQLGEHDLIGHGYGLYEESIRVPLMIKYPLDVGHKAGMVSENMQLVDVLPTLLNFLGIAIPPVVEGIVIDDIERKNGPFRGRPLLSEQNEKPANIKLFGGMFMGITKAIFCPPYKYVWYSSREDRLFDLGVDPGEENNILNEKPGIAENMRKKLAEWIAQRVPVKKKQKPQSPDEAEREHLKSLGYL